MRWSVSETEQFGHIASWPHSRHSRLVRVAAAVQQQQALLAAREPRGERLAQRRRQDRLAAGPQHRAAVHDLDPRQPLGRIRRGSRSSRYLPLFAFA